MQYLTLNLHLTQKLGNGHDFNQMLQCAFLIGRGNRPTVQFLTCIMTYSGFIWPTYIRDKWLEVYDSEHEYLVVLLILPPFLLHFSHLGVDLEVRLQLCVLCESRGRICRNICDNPQWNIILILRWNKKN